jgi:transcriptional regulator with XRE-family HTH domain
MDEALLHLSRRVRRWREELELSLHELGARSDVAASTIQKVETGQMVPSVAVMIKIARGLDRRPSELVGEDSQEDEVVLLRSKEHPVIGAGSKLRIERLSGDLFDPAIEVWRIQVAPGYGSGKGKYAYGGEEVVICEGGQVTFTTADEDYCLGGGDSLHFKASLPRQWWNSGQQTARFLIAGNFPKGLRSRLHRQIQQVGKH